MKRLITTLGLSALIFIILSPIAMADTQSTDYDSCVGNQIQQQQDQGEEIDVATAESQCAAQYPDEAGPQNMPASSSDSVSTKPVMPTIPKPALLPGPDEGSKAQDVQGYFRNKAIPGFTAGFIGLIGGMAIIALVWSGIRFISAGGEEEAITSAKKTATWAIAGFAIAILSYAIISIITSIKYPTGTTPAGAPAEEESVIYKNN